MYWIKQYSIIVLYKMVCCDKNDAIPAKQRGMVMNKYHRSMGTYISWYALHIMEVSRVNIEARSHLENTPRLYGM